MSFRFYYVTLFDGIVYGSNNEEEMKELSYNEDFFVIDTKENLVLTGDSSMLVTEETLEDLVLLEIESKKD